tara:strand:- start:1941 stop:2171 length:231 start_codon:yes stop_codon:yes gene_type:complete
MNDHQDSEHFTYERTWAEIHEMLDKAERKQNKHYLKMKAGSKAERVHHMRNYKALEGVVKALRWTLGDMSIIHPLE